MAMQESSIIVISSVVGGFTFLAFMAATYLVFARRRKRKEMYRNLSRDQEQPVRIFAVQQGKVITVTESQRNVSIRGLRWPVSMYSSGTIRSASKGRSPSRRPAGSKKQTKHVANLMQEKRSSEAATVEPTRRKPGHSSSVFPMPPEHARIRESKEKQGYSQAQEQLPVIYDSVISDSLMKAYEGVPYPKGRRKHRHRSSTAPSSLRLSLGDKTRLSTTYHPISATGHLLEPTTPVSQMSSAVDSLSWREPRRPSKTWSQASGSFHYTSQYPLPTAATGRSSAESYNNARKDLPALPPASLLQSPSIPPTSPSSTRKSSKQSKIDKSVLQAASVSAIPPSAFTSYRSSWSNGESLGSIYLAQTEQVGVDPTDLTTTEQVDFAKPKPQPPSTLPKVNTTIPLARKSTNVSPVSRRNSKMSSVSMLSAVSPLSKAPASKSRYVPTHLNLTLKQQDADVIPPLPSRPPRLPEIIDEHDPYKDKPLPSPRSHSPSFVVSPVSSCFFLDQMDPLPEPVKASPKPASPYCGHAPASTAELSNLEAASGDFLPPAIWRLG